MAFYALGVRPLNTRLSAAVDMEKCKQAWYADGSTSMGKLLELRKWWDELCQHGPDFGYYPKPSKTVLIVKKEQLQDAKHIFDGVQVSKSQLKGKDILVQS